jgi:CheY-like chemotaxis protein
LVVEDHEDSANVLSKLLKLLGHDVAIAATLREAINLCDRFEFDTILCDIGLPDGTGRDLARIVKANCPHTKVIALTGFGMPGEVREIMAAGFDIHLLKPVTIEQLREHLPLSVLPPGGDAPLTFRSK